MKMNEGQEDSVKEEKEESPFRFINNIKMTKEKKEKAVILFLAGIFFLLAATPVSSFTGKKSKQKEMEKITSEK